MTGALAASTGVVLVCAPPGYGKTTAVTAWLTASGLASAWLTLDDTDDDPAVFAAYLVAAIRRVVPGLPGSLQGAMGGGSSPASLAPLLNALASLDRPLVVVLDDYHAVTNGAVHDLVAFLARHLPSPVRLALVTRHDPPLPLARLRLQGRLVELRAADLRFSAADAKRFLADSMGLALEEPTVERLTERTEGWIAGLQLAGLSLRGSADAAAFVDAFGSSDRYLFDYLMDEALATQPPATRSFLEATCVLGRLCAPLCDALTGRDDGAAMLATLAGANLFLSPLDDRRAWFRYHRLFADLVVSSVPEDRQRDLHRRAAAWFATHDHPVEAIRHALAGGDVERAADLMEGAVELTLARGEIRTVRGWCDALPADVLAGHPALAVMRAWATFFAGDIAGAERLLGGLGDGDVRDERVAARRTCLEAWFANRHDRPDAERLARRAVAGIPDSDPVFRSLAFTTLGESLVGRDARAAVEAFEVAHTLAEVAGRSALRGGTVYSLANTSIVVGRRRDAEALCRRTLQEATRGGGGSPAWLGMVHLPLGTALFEADELVQARQHIAIGQELCERAGLRITMLGAAEWYEVFTLHLLGDREQAWHRLEAIRREAERVGILRVSTAMTLAAAELLLLEGDPSAASARLNGLPEVPPDVLGTVRDRSRLTKGRVHAAVARPDEAVRVLEPLTREQRDGHRSGRLVWSLAALAHARDAAGDRPGAAGALAEAVRLGAEEGYRRAFVDPVLSLAALLPLVRHVAPGFVGELMRGSGSPGPEAAVAGSGPRVPVAAFSPGGLLDEDAPALVEPLSVRELEVLRLVAAGLSNEEIGRELYVSSGTAKWHVHNVIGKLGARNRVTLVARARALRLV